MSSEFSGLISFRIYWIHLLAIQETLKSFFKHHRLKASVLQHSAVFMVQISHPYMTSGKRTALTIWTFVGKVISLLFNMLSSFFVIAFLPRSKNFLISWLQSPSAVIVEAKKLKSFMVSILFPSICYEAWQRCGSEVACCRVGGTECSTVCLGPLEGGCH